MGQVVGIVATSFLMLALGVISLSLFLSDNPIFAVPVVMASPFVSDYLVKRAKQY